MTEPAGRAAAKRTKMTTAELSAMVLLLAGMSTLWGGVAWVAVKLLWG